MIWLMTIGPTRGYALGKPVPCRNCWTLLGSSTPNVREAMATLAGEGIQLDTMRLRAFPFSDAVSDFINAHDQVFLVEQNRDAQMRSLLVNECDIDPARFISILHFDGTPITARFIIGAVAERLSLSSREAAE